jgi:hypothetical protein
VEWINEFWRDFSKLVGEIYGATEDTKIEVQLSECWSRSEVMRECKPRDLTVRNNVLYRFQETIHKNEVLNIYASLDGHKNLTNAVA